MLSVWLLNFDRKHVVFGKLVKGHDTLKKIERVETDEAKPVVPVKIVSCGELLDSRSQGAVLQENGTVPCLLKIITPFSFSCKTACNIGCVSYGLS